MKTTVSLPDRLWLWAKTQAAREQISLSDIVEKALWTLRRKADVASPDSHRRSHAGAHKAG